MKDKQLNVEFKAVMETRRLDQALSIKEFAVADGNSYSLSRDWFPRQNSREGRGNDMRGARARSLDDLCAGKDTGDFESCAFSK